MTGPVPPHEVPGDEADARITVFEAVGGRPFFDRLVDDFYDGVETDPLLRPLYPEDLTASRPHMAGFLAQYWGGGTAQYSDERGHPRLRMRHMPFTIGFDEARAWLGHMEAAVRAQGLPDEIAEAMTAYFVNAATHLVNVG
ncbi:globin [Iamia sp.]|uniref:globin domain-containing protein n=1 Tax=Iamia sp. TaxID=2722710 RepID=UPI002BF71B37|nr:globin [Iamia sp.]HXH58106.1 globin [Iamia sp.]